MTAFCSSWPAPFCGGGLAGLHYGCSLASNMRPTRSVRTANARGRPVHFSSVGNPSTLGHYDEARTRSRWSMSNRDARESKLKLAVLVSGGGRSLENICDRIEAGRLTGCTVSVVIASKKSAGAIPRAERFGISTRVLRLRDFESDTERFSDAISTLLDVYAVDLVVLAGWMHFYLIPPRYEGKVINIHPSLIPAFCGKGYYGQRVHEAVLNFGAKITGCTVHLADNKYDHGPIILQKAVAVMDSDTADDLAARVFESEKEALPEAIQLFVDDRLSVDGRLIRVRPKTLSAEL